MAKPGVNRVNRVNPSSRAYEQPGQPGQPGQYGQPSYEQGPGQPPFEQGPSQPWGQPGVPPDGGSSKRNLLPFIVAGAVVVVIAVVLLVVLVSNSGGSSGSPQDTAEDFVAAAKAGDCDKALALITDKLAESEDANCDDKSEFLPAEDSGVEFGDVKVTDETAARAIADEVGLQHRHACAGPPLEEWRRRWTGRKPAADDGEIDRVRWIGGRAARQRRPPAASSSSCREVRPMRPRCWCRPPP